MRRNIIAACMLAACLGMVSCDDTTDTLGGSLIDNGDRLSIKTDDDDRHRESDVAVPCAEQF